MDHFRNALKLVIAIGVSQAAGLLGALVTTRAIPEWYSLLIKPELAPPNWIFAPVWTTLYTLMGIAAFLVWQKGFDRRDVRLALGIFLVQLILNAAWSFIFFGLRNPEAAFVEIVLLWLAIIGTIVVFARVSRTSALILVPYLLWVTFAAYLNLAISTLNS